MKRFFLLFIAELAITYIYFNRPVYTAVTTGPCILRILLEMEICQRNLPNNRHTEQISITINTLFAQF